MFTGGQREFSFVKESMDDDDWANFINTIEDTLSSYHK